jgi:hypothetical protein
MVKSSLSIFTEQPDSYRMLIRGEIFLSIAEQGLQKSVQI